MQYAHNCTVTTYIANSYIAHLMNKNANIGIKRNQNGRRSIKITSISTIKTIRRVVRLLGFVYKHR